MQELGEEKREGVVYSVLLKRVRYCGHQGAEPDSGPAHLRWMSEKVRVVQAGTLERLVEHLAPQPGVMGVSHAYRTCFLCTYRSFAEPRHVMELLVHRYAGREGGGVVSRGVVCRESQKGEGVGRWPYLPLCGYLFSKWISLKIH